MPELRDHYLVAFILGILVEQALGCELIAQTETSDRDEYPFVTFSFITMETDETLDWIREGRLYTTEMQIDCHARQLYQANDMAMKLYEALRGPVYRHYFTQADIIPQRVDNTSNRSILEDINYDYDFGFDVEFLVRSKKWDADQLKFEPYEDIDIESISAKDSNGSTSSATKKIRR